MNIEEAIDYLEWCINGLDSDFDNAVSMAITALRVQQEVKKKWIRVEDMLPKREQEVRLLCEVRPSGRTYQCQGFYLPDGVYRQDSDYLWSDEACNKYDEEREDYLVNEGWYECIHNCDEYSAVPVEDFVTHWMPLPEPPKEK